MQSQARNRPQPHTSARTAAKVRTIFKEVWVEFCAWEANFTTETLQVAAIDSKAKSVDYQQAPLRANGAYLPTSGDSTPLNHVDGTKSRATETFLVLELYGDSISTEDAVKVETITLTDFEPCSSYQGCTPIPANLLQGDDPSDLKFIPLADDPTFNAAEYFADYEHLAWQLQEKEVDPDYPASR
ncbi:hypothetical protein EVJ58_g8483 [Rhodofomes roseus]|uniref:Uncharacterized protein n=1 Tax=Rhodofomes roseus TaxID=34475 RepID=A0A4Y9XZF1_9APHY|nr:hypothetical protein EVJ58_g8483 [Rhodofomes roseus]